MAIFRKKKPAGPRKTSGKRLGQTKTVMMSDDSFVVYCCILSAPRMK